MAASKPPKDASTTKGKRSLVLQDDRGTFYRLPADRLEEFKLSDEETEKLLSGSQAEGGMTSAPGAFVRATPSFFAPPMPTGFIGDLARATPAAFVRATPSFFAPPRPTGFIGDLARATPAAFVRATPSFFAPPRPAAFVRATPTAFARPTPSAPRGSTSPEPGSGSIVRSWIEEEGA